MIKKKGLGRGLGALLQDPVESTDKLLLLDVDDLQPGKYQPRTAMDRASLDELAQSIKQQGVIQPILVRIMADDRYEIIAGERRWRAARLAGLTEIPAVVREVPDEQAAIAALIENIQREDLNPVEEALGLQRLIQEFGMTHATAAEAVGKSRSAVTNYLRLLALAEPVREFLLQGQLEMGHARALIPLSEEKQIALAKKIVLRGLSVREVERLSQIAQQDDKVEEKPVQKIDPKISMMLEETSARLGTQVSIRQAKNGAGRVTIDFDSPAHLETLLARFSEK
jgi:ParB family chromosome partitioning protein